MVMRHANASASCCGASRVREMLPPLHAMLTGTTLIDLNA